MAMILSFLIREGSLEALNAALDRNQAFIEHQSPPSPNGMIAIQATFPSEELVENFARNNATSIQVF